MKDLKKIIEFVKQKDEEKKREINRRLEQLKDDIVYLVYKHGKAKTEKILRNSFFNEQNAVFKASLQFMNTVSEPQRAPRR